MEIMLGCGTFLWMERILRYYLDHLYMVARAGRYYGTPFNRHQGVTQGYTLSTTIFNMVVDAVIHP